MGEVKERVFVSATVEESVQVEIPKAFVLEQALSAFEDPLAAKTGVVPEIGFPLASFKVIVIAEVEVPFGSTGVVPVIVECTELAGPGLNAITFPLTLTGDESVSVLISATVEVIVQVEIPVTLLELLQTEYALPEAVLVAAKVGTIFPTGALLESFNVTVIVDVEVPFAVTGVVPEILELPALTLLVTNATVPPILFTGDVIVKIFVSPTVDFNWQVEIPEILVTEHAP
jgi:hypothetical protein